MIAIEIANEQTRVPVDEDRLHDAIRAVIGAGAWRDGSISLAVVDDESIHTLNRNYLQHDYPTDVLSFVLERSAESLHAEIIVSADTALAAAEGYGWRAEDELLLYVIHGALHLAGYDDKSPAGAAEMREQEAIHLATFGLRPHWQEHAPGVGAVPAQSAQLLGEGIEL